MCRWLLLIFLGAPVAHTMSLSDMACGATICLGGDGGSACAPYLDKYYSIDGPTKAATKRMRKAFLKLCPRQEAPDLTYLEREPVPQLTEVQKKGPEKHYEELFKRMRQEAGVKGMDVPGNNSL